MVQELVCQCFVINKSDSIIGKQVKNVSNLNIVVLKTVSKLQRSHCVYWPLHKILKKMYPLYDLNNTSDLSVKKIS